MHSAVSAGRRQELPPWMATWGPAGVTAPNDHLANILTLLWVFAIAAVRSLGFLLLQHIQLLQ